MLLSPSAQGHAEAESVQLSSCVAGGTWTSCAVGFFSSLFGQLWSVTQKEKQKKTSCLSVFCKIWTKDNMVPDIIVKSEHDV